MNTRSKRYDVRSSTQETTRLGLHPILKKICDKIRKKGDFHSISGTKIPPSPDSTALIQCDESFRRSGDCSLKSIDYNPYITALSHSKDETECAVAWDNATYAISSSWVTDDVVTCTLTDSEHDVKVVHQHFNKKMPSRREAKSTIDPLRQFDLSEMEEYQSENSTVDSSRISRHGKTLIGSLLCPFGGCRNRNNGILHNDNFYDRHGNFFDNSTVISIDKLGKHDIKRNLTTLEGNALYSEDSHCNALNDMLDFSIFRPLNLNFTLPVENQQLVNVESSPFHGIKRTSEPDVIQISANDSLDEIFQEDVIQMDEKGNIDKVNVIEEKKSKQENNTATCDSKFVKIHVVTNDYPTNKSRPNIKRHRACKSKITLGQSKTGSSTHESPPKTIKVPIKNLHDFMKDEKRKIGKGLGIANTSVKVSQISLSDDESRANSFSTLSNDRHTLRHSNRGSKGGKVDLEEEFFRTLWEVSENFYNERKTKSFDMRQRASKGISRSSIDCSSGCAFLSGHISSNSTYSSDCSKKVTIENEYMDWLNSKIDQVLDNIERENEILDHIEVQYDREKKTNSNIRKSKRRQRSKAIASSKKSEWDERNDENWNYTETSEHSASTSFLEESFEPILKPICRLVMASQLPPLHSSHLLSSARNKNGRKINLRQNSCRSMPNTSHLSLSSALSSLPSISLTHTDQATI
jgi:hypothetical protein